MENISKINSFRDLRVYNNSYKAMFVVIKEVLPKLPKPDAYDVYDQLNRSSKAIPRLIAEGFAKRFQKAGFQKYLFDALAESNETIVSLEQSRDLYNVNSALANKLIDDYDMISRQIFKLLVAWNNFKFKTDSR